MEAAAAARIYIKISPPIVARIYLRAGVKIFTCLFSHIGANIVARIFLRAGAKIFINIFPQIGANIGAHFYPRISGRISGKIFPRSRFQARKIGWSDYSRRRREFE